ncbi:Asp-tRNA(Asn)/Glu-tRNA(Gln) amidotransferase subunit GatC [Treponema sp. R6D11]
MSKHINEDVVKHIAHLARLNIEKIDETIENLSNIVEQADLLANLDTTGVEPTNHAIPLENVFREDILGQSYSRDDMLKNSTNKAGCYVVPRTFEGDV